MEEIGFQQSPSVQQPTSRNSSSGLRKIVFILIVLLILSGIGFGGYKFFKSKKGESKKTTVTPTPTENVFPTDTPSPTATVSATPNASSPTKAPTATPRPTQNPVDKKTGLDRSTLSVSVQNGSGEIGVASKMSDFLKNLGYHVVSVGNADNFNYENVAISVKSDKNDFLGLLKTDLSGTYTVGTTSANLSASSSADTVVIVGK